ncbi:MAG: glycosyltransferase family 1 protein [Anaerolineae bacterium]|nr:glycosyltransferase family 1 protein [Anaerolineae bacterium]
MRVLFTLQPMFGHFHAMVPLALALKDHGHEVAFATGESFGPVVEHVGFRHFTCGRDCEDNRHMLEELPEWPSIEEKVDNPGVRQLWGFILGFAPQMLDDLIDLIGEWQPDLIVRDPSEFASTVAAELFDLPYASIHWALYISTWGCDEPLNALRRRCGLPDDPDFASFDRYFILNALPPSWELHPDRPRVIHRFCMPPFDQSVSGSLPAWVGSLPDQPTIYATLGTAFNRQPGHFRALIDAFSAEAFNAIITVGKSTDPARFNPLPENVKVERYIPQTLILPTCDVIIFHGGFNSLHSAIWHGLPMVITPQGGGDQRPAADQCDKLGLGVIVEGDPPEPGAINRAVRTVLEQPSYRQRVGQFRSEMMALPDLSEAVRRLENLARTREPQI